MLVLLGDPLDALECSSTDEEEQGYGEDKALELGE